MSVQYGAMSDQAPNLWHTNLGALLAAETEQAALEAAVVAVADLLDGPAVGVLKGRAEHLSSIAAQGQDQYIAPLLVEALRVADPRLTDRSQHHHDLMLGQPIEVIPLRAESQLFGAICAAPSPERDMRDWTQLDLLELALIRTVQRIRRLEETRLLYEISLRLSSTLDLFQLLYEVLELTRVLFAASASRVFLADERAGDLVVTLNPDPQSLAVESQRIAINGSIAGQVVRSGVGLIRNDPHDASLPDVASETGVPLGKLICVPLRQADRTLGALMLVNPYDGPDFGPEDLRLLTTVAGTIAVMIANARLYQRAVRDALTGAYNRGAFDNTLREYWSRWERRGVGFALVMIDLDDFKQINDHFGHPTGDAALQAVTRLLWEALREEDSIFRYGGEEFALLLSGLADAENAATVAERVRATLDREITIGNLVRLKISASLGVALHPLHGAASAHELLDLADEAAYRAKRGGKNRVALALA